jgi:hypothetical protein
LRHWCAIAKGANARLCAISNLPRDFSMVEQNGLRHWCAIEFWIMARIMTTSFWHALDSCGWGVSASVAALPS